MEAQQTQDREEWRPVAGLDALYEVSNLGRVRSLRFVNRMVDKLRAEPLLLRFNDRKGYSSVRLYADGKSTRKSVHVLVLEAFHGPRPSGFQSGHLDGHSENNRASNLAWITASTNMEHQRIHGVLNAGERHYNHKLTAEQVAEIRQAYESGQLSQRALARKFDMSRGGICAVLRGRTWKR